MIRRARFVNDTRSVWRASADRAQQRTRKPYLPSAKSAASKLLTKVASRCRKAANPSGERNDACHGRKARTVAGEQIVPHPPGTIGRPVARQEVAHTFALSFSSHALRRLPGRVKQA
jgi:hypothetical protein